jgi:hypothetical protein
MDNLIIADGNKSKNISGIIWIIVHPFAIVKLMINDLTEKVISWTIKDF